MDDELAFTGNDPGAARFGNFINYYQFHPPETRVNSLPSDLWKTLKSEHCVGLDIGCNSGDLTCDLYSFLSNNSGWEKVSLLGVDIDPILISRANDHKKENVSFECLDIMANKTKEHLEKYLGLFGKTKFDIIFCFSVTMWIHLNFGDEGLKHFLHLLCQMGKFIVIEPQPWKCYRNATRRMKKHSKSFPLYPNLKIRGDVDFQIENMILATNLFDKVHETVSLEWSRKLFFFKER